MTQNRVLPTAVGVAVFLLAACSGDGTTGPNPNPSTGNKESVSLSVTVPTSAAAPSVGPSSPAFDLTFTEGTDELIITRVALVLKEVELKRQEDNSCEDSSDGKDDDNCEEFKAGPFLLELPLTDTVETVVTLTGITPGTYDELQFEIHKPGDDDSNDMTFLNDNPDFRDVSIRVEGTFNGTPFTFLSDLDEEQKVTLDPPLVIDPMAMKDTTNLTLSVDVSMWFRGANNVLIDPSTANKGGDNENLVRDNIRRSLGSFEDDNKNGKDDNGEDSGDNNDGGDDNNDGGGEGGS